MNVLYYTAYRIAYVSVYKVSYRKQVASQHSRHNCFGQEEGMVCREKNSFHPV